jgi:hypothetical protein
MLIGSNFPTHLPFLTAQESILAINLGKTWQVSYQVSTVMFNRINITTQINVQAHIHLQRVALFVVFVHICSTPE